MDNSDAKPVHYSAAWIVVPLYLIYFYVLEILEGLNVAAGSEKKTR